MSMPRHTPAYASDPVAAEIALLRQRLAGNLQSYQTASSAIVDEAEKLARLARGSRPGMRAVTAQPATPDEGGEAATSGLTARFRALR